jgi:nucleoside-diphosphate-sugar epimerase
MRTVLITGAAGFVGSYCSREFAANGWQVICLDNKDPLDSPYEVIVGSVENKDLIFKAAKRANVIIHLAGLLGSDYLCSKPDEAIMINLIGSMNIFETARYRGLRVIHLGLLPEWDNPYMISKKAAMKLGRMYRREFQTDVITLEASHIYGPGQRCEPYHKAIPTFITRAVRNETITIFGSGKKLMDCIFVEDLVRALRLMAEKESLQFSVFQLGSLQVLTVVQLADKIISLSDSKSKLEFRPMRPGFLTPLIGVANFLGFHLLR